MWQRDKSDLPLPISSYKYFLLGYSFSITSFYSPTLLSWRRHCSRAPRTPTRTPFNNSQVFDLLPCEEMAINFVVPEVSVLPFFPVLLLYPCSSAICLTESFFTLFFFSLPKISRIWPIRSAFLPINPISNASVH